MKILCLIVIVGLIEGSVSALISSKLCYSFGVGCVDVPILLSIILSLIVFYGTYLFWEMCQIQLIFKGLINKKKNNFYFNIDLIKLDDHKWRNEIRQRAKNKENLVAYSKNGALEARSKAKVLGIEKYFVDFKSKDEVEKDRGW